MANLLTSVRLLLILPVAWGMANPQALPAALLLVLILVAIVTDYFDGIVARAQGTASAGGRLFDHGADFLFVTSGLAGAAYVGLIPTLLPVVIVIAFSQYVLDSFYLYRQKQLRMSFLGRWNGIFYFVPLLLIAGLRLFTSDMLNGWPARTVAIVGYLLLASTVISIIDRTIAPWRRDSEY